jgi:hypothetical protein
MRIDHNIQKAETMEDMGGNMPRIYANFDKNQVEYQSHVIIVEGKIDNYP